jgi:AcrR family transcriptional regulator
MSSQGNGSAAAGQPPASGPGPARDQDGGATERTFWSGFDLLWGLVDQPAPSRRRGGPVLDRDGIVRAAIAIADAHGMEAVTMRRVAERLGTGAMSLYRHVPDKDAVVSLMIDTVLGDLFAAEPLPAGVGWRPGLRRMAETTWQVCRDHPWYPEATIAQPPLTPNGTAGLEAALSLFDGIGIDIAAKMQFVTTVHFTVLHAAMNLAMEERTRARSNVTDAQIMAMASTFVQKLISSGDYPRVAELLTQAWGGRERGPESEPGPGPGDERDMALAGVDLILDGIESRLARLTEAGQSRGDTLADVAGPTRRPQARPPERGQP